MIKTVGELIEDLQTLPKEARVYTKEPPFTGLILVEQGDGSFLVAPPDRTRVLREERDGRC